MKLSILVCSVLERGNTFLPKILKQLQDQITPYSKDVELLLLMDNCTSMMLGEKRNKLVRMAQGKYCVAIDDDVISDDYVKTLLHVIQREDVDVINFVCNVSINDGPYKPCYYSKEFKVDHNLPDRYNRLPNHISCVRRELMLITPFQNIIRGEDAAYSKDLLPKLKTEYNINQVLYYYNYSSTTTVAQQKIKKK